MAKMSDQSLKAICQGKLNNSLGWMGGPLSKNRIKAQEYYRGEFFGNEQEGRSKVVSRDVAEAIDSAMPSLVKVFASIDNAVICEPRKPEDEKSSAQATDYLNWIWQTLPDSFDLLQSWIKGGLMDEIGVVKSWWDDSEEVTTEEYEGLTRNQYLTLLSSDEVEPLDVKTRAPEKQEIDPNTPPPAMPQLTPGMPPQPMAQPMQPGLMGMQEPQILYDCKIKRTKKYGRICVEALPPEEFLTEKRIVSLETASFAAHRSRRTVTDLIEMGFSKSIVEGLSSTGDMDFNSEVITRFLPEDTEPTRDSENLDPSMREVWVAECYLKVDFNGDGVAEWRKVILAGAEAMEILENEECDGHPFSAWTPYKTPYKLFGESMADKTMDLQLIKSTVWRQVLDGMYFNNAPQLVVIEGQANMEDVLTRRPGGVIRTKSMGAVTPLPVQDTSGSGFQMISYLDSVRETRTGIRRFSSGLDGDELNPYASTATGINKVDDASQDALMLIARNFSEMGLKKLFKRMLELICKHQDKMQTVRLRGQWVNIDPSEWSTEMDMTVTVGLGTGNHDKQATQLGQMIANVDMPIIQMQQGLDGPIIKADNLYKKLAKLSQALGYKDADGFYTDPATQPPQPPKPDPAMAKVQGQLQLAQQKGQMEMQQKQQQGALDAHLEQEKAQREAQQEAAQAQADMVVQRQKAQLQAETEQRAASHQAELDTMRAQHQMQLDHMKAMADIEVARMKAEVDAHVKIATAKAVAKASKAKKQPQATA